MLLPEKKNRGRWKRSVPVIRKGIICELSQSPNGSKSSRREHRRRAIGKQLASSWQAVGKIPSQLSSIKVNFVSCLFKVIIHLAAAGFFGGCLFSALRYSLVAWFFSVIALFQGITGIKALPALLDFSRKVSLRREKA